MKFGPEIVCSCEGVVFGGLVLKMYAGILYGGVVACFIL